MKKKQLRFRQGVLVKSRELDGSEVVTKDGAGKEIERRPLTETEAAQVAAESQPTAAEERIADINAATDLESLKAALVKERGD